MPARPPSSVRSWAPAGPSRWAPTPMRSHSWTDRAAQPGSDTDKITQAHRHPNATNPNSHVFAGSNPPRHRPGARPPGKEGTRHFQDASRHRIHRTQFEGRAAIYRRIHPQGHRRRRTAAQRRGRRTLRMDDRLVARGRLSAPGIARSRRGSPGGHPARGHRLERRTLHGGVRIHERGDVRSHPETLPPPRRRVRQKDRRRQDDRRPGPHAQHRTPAV